MKGVDGQAATFCIAVSF